MGKDFDLSNNDFSDDAEFCTFAEKLPSNQGKRRGFGQSAKPYRRTDPHPRRENESLLNGGGDETKR